MELLSNKPYLKDVKLQALYGAVIVVTFTAVLIEAIIKKEYVNGGLIFSKQDKPFSYYTYLFLVVLVIATFCRVIMKSLTK